MISALRRRLADGRKQLALLNRSGERTSRWLARKTFTTADRMTLYEDLAFLLDNNLKIEKALTVMVASFGKKQPPVVFCLQDALSALVRGKSIYQGLAAWIPRQEAAILSAGTQDGDLAAALYRAITVVKGMAEMKGTLVRQLAYPAMMLVTTFGMMKMVTTYFLPRLEALAPRDSWTGSLAVLSNLSSFFVDNAWLLGALLFVLIAAIVWSLPNLTGRARRTVLDRLPPWNVYRDVQGVGFLLNFSALMRAQVLTKDALDMLSRYAPPWLYERLVATRQQVNQGKHLGLALRDAGYDFPSARAIDKLVLLTDGDNAEVVIENFARVWLEKTIISIRRTASVLSTLALFSNMGYMILIVLATQDLNSLVGIR